MLANDLQIILMAMSGVLYKRTLHEDESPLPIHDSEDGNADIEMDDLVSLVVLHCFVIVLLSCKMSK